MTRKAEEIQEDTGHNECKNFFATTRAVYETPVKGATPFISADGTTLLNVKSQILKRWVDHFRSVLNRSSTMSDAAIVRLPQV
ncbi:unnamed protein product [Schistocephalus solidus]|uniref:Uncharacterized protein n=1 Tax=Schistocephalus solidus TaxID=70667 RepID=A0A183TER5_SCHSO|nr:unnamed protein product [Schistocephalus solidus]